MRQLAPDVSYRSLVALGVASVQGLAVASFERDDATRLLFFSKKLENNIHVRMTNPSIPPWMRQPLPSRKRHIINQETGRNNGLISTEKTEFKGMESGNGYAVSQKPKIAALRPIPHIRHQKMLPFAGISETNGYDFGGQVKTNVSSVPLNKHNSAGSAPVTHRKSLSSSYQAKQLISLNPLPLKKHGCDRSPIHVCSEVSHISKSIKCHTYMCVCGLYNQSLSRELYNHLYVLLLALLHCNPPTSLSLSHHISTMVCTSALCGSCCSLQNWLCIAYVPYVYLLLQNTKH